MEEKKLTYKEIQENFNNLKNEFTKLYNEYSVLRERYNKAVDVINILPYYIEIVKNRDSFDSEFVDKCQHQLESVLVPNNEEVNNNKKSE